MKTIRNLKQLFLVATVSCSGIGLAQEPTPRECEFGARDSSRFRLMSDSAPACLHEGRPVSRYRPWGENTAEGCQALVREHRTEVHQIAQQTCYTRDPEGEVTPEDYVVFFGEYGNWDDHDTVQAETEEGLVTCTRIAGRNIGISMGFYCVHGEQDPYADQRYRQACEEMNGMDSLFPDRHADEAASRPSEFFPQNGLGNTEVQDSGLQLTIHSGFTYIRQNIFKDLEIRDPYCRDLFSRRERQIRVLNELKAALESSPEITSARAEQEQIENNRETLRRQIRELQEQASATRQFILTAEESQDAINATGHNLSQFNEALGDISDLLINERTLSLEDLDDAYRQLQIQIIAAQQAAYGHLEHLLESDRDLPGHCELIFRPHPYERNNIGEACTCTNQGCEYGEPELAESAPAPGSRSIYEIR